MNLAVVIITKNEESNIAQCIGSIHAFCDEVILVDSYSTDATVAIASQFEKVKIFQREFDNYISQKNYSNSLVNARYILSLDADEYADDTLIEFIQAKTYAVYDIVSFLRVNYIGDKKIEHGLWSRDRKWRLWRNGVATWAGSIPHEHLEYHKDLKSLQSTARILHNAYSSSETMWHKSERYAQLAAKNYTYRSRLSLIWSMVFNSIFKFIKGYFLLKGFRDGHLGWELAKVSTYETFLKYFYALKLKK